MENLIGLLLPPFIDWMNSQVKNEKIKFVGSIMACVLVGVVINIPKLKFMTVEDVLESIGLIFVGAQVSYRLYWKESNVRAILQGD